MYDDGLLQDLLQAIRQQEERRDRALADGNARLYEVECAKFEQLVEGYVYVLQEHPLHMMRSYADSSRRLREYRKQKRLLRKQKEAPPKQEE